MSHRFRVILSLLLTATAATGCSATTDLGSPRTVDVTRVDVKAAVSSNETLTRALVGAFQKQPGNMIYSPLSLEAVLGMLYAGAHGETASQIGALLGAAADDTLHNGLGLLLNDLKGDHGYQLDLANRVYVDDSVPVLQEYASVMRDDYHAPQEMLDYSDPEAARATMNQWVAEQTQNEIPELLQAGQVDQATVMNVLNAVYFKADWLHGFKAENTHDAPFRRADGSSVSVPMMHMSSTLRAAKLSNAQLVELPYRSGDISFLAVLPSETDGIEAVEQMLGGAALSELVGQLSESEQQIGLPRFSLRARYDLIATLTSLGVSDLFHPGAADLSGIDGMRDLFVDLFQQEALVRVDEQGTVAAAATAAGLSRHAPPPEITFDHPFVFFIYDNRTGSVLFTGRVADPS